MRGQNQNVEASLDHRKILLVEIAKKKGISEVNSQNLKYPKKVNAIITTLDDEARLSGLLCLIRWRSVGADALTINKVRDFVDS